MRFLVTGGNGFIGSHLSASLGRDGHLVRSLARSGSGRHVWPGSELVEHHVGDFGVEAEAARALRDVDVCFHLACSTTPKTSNEDLLFDLDSNLLATVRMLQVARESGLRKLVFLSSGGTVYGPTSLQPISEAHPTFPICSHGIMKLAIEHYLRLFGRLYGLNYTIIRAANVYGEGQHAHGGQGVVAAFLANVLNDEPIEIWGDGSAVRDYIHVEDVVAALKTASARADSETVFNIGSGIGHSLLQLLDIIDMAVGRTSKRLFKPARDFDVSSNTLCVKRAHDLLDWQPKIPLSVGVAHVANWMANETMPRSDRARLSSERAIG